MATAAIGELDDLALAVRLQPSGRIVVAGYTTTSSFFSSSFAVVRYEADGSLDPSFGAKASSSPRSWAWRATPRRR